MLGVSVIVTAVAGRTSDNSVPADNKNINTTQPSSANSKQPTVIVTGETADISIECNEIKIITPSEATAEELVKSKWSSSDNNIVTVDDGGRIDGLSEGTATITAQIGNTRHTYNITVAAQSQSIYDGYSTCYLATLMFSMKILIIFTRKILILLKSIARKTALRFTLMTKTANILFLSVQ